MPRRRLGVVLAVPAPLASEIDALRLACGDGSLGAIAPHLTLVPPVNVREEDLARGSALLREVAGDTRPIAVELGPPSTFHPDTPVLYLPVGGSPVAVAEVVLLRDRVFRDPFERQLTWPFVPHVTLADEQPPERLEASVAALADYRRAVTFDRIQLLEEVRDAAGRRVWEPLAEALLAGRRVVGRGGVEIVVDAAGSVDPEAAAFEAAELPAALVEQLGGDPPPREGLVVAARRQGELVGVARGITHGELARLALLLVGVADRGLGIGTQLARAFEAAAVERGCRSVVVRLPAEAPAGALWERLGYQVEARFAGWSHGGTEIQLRRWL